MKKSIELLLATKNKNKVKEIISKLSLIPGLSVISGEDAPEFPDVIEDGHSFKENAVKKAKEISIHTGLTAMADDSGLIIDALDGKPGIYSARYGNCANDDQRNDLILQQMTGKEKRDARFVCVIAIAFPGGEIITTEGTCEGSIIEEKRGADGFGYDPIFLVKDSDLTLAEISMKEKNKISHRARALDKAAEKLKSL
jgi:XTP/dITP diphosphohydrolase